MLYPFLLTPIYKNYIWGGHHIPAIFQRESNLKKIAESWEISDRTEGMSVIENGPLKGTPLAELFQNQKEALMGKDIHHNRFPLLIKLIDAEEPLSIQVHPNDETAKQFGGEAKTEAWHILDAKKDAVIYAGLNAHYSKEEILKNLPSKKILSLMRTLPVHKGDTFFIPGGRLHAIGSGCLILEVQQNSNTTYRVYDWGRDRPLHLKEAEQVLLYDDISNPHILPKLINQTPDFAQIELIRTPYFIIERWELRKKIKWPKLENQSEMLFCLQGENSLIPVGRSCLIPAKCSPPIIETKNTTFFRVFLP